MMKLQVPAILCAVLLGVGTLPSQDDSRAPSQISPAVAKLSSEERGKLRDHLKSASDYVARDRLADAFRELDAAEALAPELYSVWNLRGAAWVRLKDVAKARAAFTKANQMSPGSWDVRFNLAELLFVEHQFAKARTTFAGILEDHPRIPSTQYDLISFKIFLCLIREGNKEVAAKVEKRFEYLDDTPAFYYAKAARAYEMNDKIEASSWIASAGRIFTPAQNQVYLDSLIELGWVQSIEEPTVGKAGEAAAAAAAAAPSESLTVPTPAPQ